MEAPAYFQSGFYRAAAHQHQFAPENLKQEPFVVEEFFDFSNEDDQNVVVLADVKPQLAAFDHNAGGGGVNSAESSSVTAVDSCNSNSLGAIGQRSLADGNFAGELCVPYDDIAELEWLSTFAEESFSTEDMKKLQLISGMTARPDEARLEISDLAKPNSSLCPEMPVPGKARSKRSRAAPGNWASRLLVLSPTSSTSSEVEPFPTTGGKSLKVLAKKKEGVDHVAPSSDGRRCLHCQTDKTPQWRTGPMGPKTLCNACGVRYKSGRLVPEYRPAASPTFVLTKHSNSHRKVMELRRQKEMHRPQTHQQQHHLHHHPQHFLQQQQQQPQNMMFDHVSNGEDYLIHQHMGPDYRQLI